MKIYKGIFPHIVLHSMHHDWHTPTTLNKIDAWHCRLLRRTMKVKTTYIDRSKPNPWVYQHVNAGRLSDIMRRRRRKYIAHIARHPDDLIHKVSNAPHGMRQLNAPRCRGRPRHHWTPYTEQSITHACEVAGRPPSNRQQLFKVCEDRAFIKK